MDGGADSQDDPGRSARRADPIAELKEAWRNEKFAPEILDYEHSLVQNLLQRTSANDAYFESQPTELFANQMRMMDNDRVKFIVRGYLRTRLWKIQDKFMYILTTPGHRQRLSPAELKFAEGLRKLFEEHCSASALHAFPPELRALDKQGQNMIPEPDLDSFVAARVLADVGPYQISEDNDPVQLSTNNVLVAKYSALKTLLERRQLRLI